MSVDIIALKKLKDSMTKQLDQALEEHARAAEGWAMMVRLLFAALFAASAVWTWNHPSNAGSIYLGLSLLWLAMMIVVRLLIKRRVSDSYVTAATMIDLTIVNLGLIAFVQQGLFPRIGSGLYLCYFPILAVAANRYRIGLVISAGTYALIFYPVLSLAGGSPPWLRMAILASVVAIFVAGSRKPKNLLVDVGAQMLQESYEIGARQKELDLTARVHQLFFPPPIIDLPAIWSSSKHGAGTVTGGDYYHIFETDRGPLVAIGDLSGEGFEALGNVAEIHRQLSEIVAKTGNLPEILASLNEYAWNKFQGQRTFTCILARWEDEQMHYINAGHLPALQMSKQEHRQLPVTSGAVGAAAQADFQEQVVPFPARDLFIAYTDGIYAKLTSDREKGIAEIETLAEKFSGGEVNTLCHRIFDCAQPGFEPNQDDSTIVVIRRQPSAASASA